MITKKSYKHDLYLIEPTKLLEGIVCQSITFTNGITREYQPVPLNNITVTGLNSAGEPLTSGTISVYENALIYANTIIRNNEASKMGNPVFVPLVFADNLAQNLATYYAQYGSSGVYWENPTASWSGTLRSLSVLSGENEINYVPGEKINDIQNPITITIKCDFLYSRETTIEAHRNVTFRVNVTVAEGALPTKPWTITDCINRCLELAEPIFRGQNPRYRLQGVTYENGEITPYDNDHKYEPGSLAEKYDKIMAPEFTMTQCTLREQLKIIGGFIHCEPRLGYQRERGAYESNTIIFEPYTVGTQAEIAKLPYIQRSYSQSVADYSTEVVSNVQNVVNSLDYAQGVTIEPNINNYKTVRTDNINVKLSESISKIKTQMPIYSVIEVKCGMYDSSGAWAISPVDITPYVFEAHEYSNLSSYSGAYPYVKSYAIYYTQGSHDIDGLFFRNEDVTLFDYFKNYAIENILAAKTGIPVNNIKNLVTNGFQYLAFQVSYIPIYNTMLSHGKQLVMPNPVNPFATIYSQSENLTEMRYMGENIKGVAQRIGNVEQVRTYKVGKKSMIPKVGQMIDDFYISFVSYDVMPWYYKVTVGLTKDFNRISQYVGVNSVKRISEVSERQAYNRSVLIKEKVCIGDNDDIPLQPSRILRTIIPITKMFGAVSNRYNQKITACVSRGRAKSYEKDLNNTKIVLPVVASAFGNTMVFGWSYKDNYSAGEQITVSAEDGNWQTDVPYCDYYGRIFWYDFQLFDNYPDGGLEQALTVTTDYDMDDVNGAGSYIGTQNNDLEALNEPYRLRKDSRESITVNYCVEFVTDRQDINIGSALASLNPLVRTWNAPKYGAIVKFFDKQIDKLEGNEVNLGTVLDSRPLTVDNSGTISFELSYRPFKSWAIVYPRYRNGTDQYSDEDGNIVTVDTYKGGEILISCNKSRAEYEAKVNGNEQTPIQESLSIKAYSNY